MSFRGKKFGPIFLPQEDFPMIGLTVNKNIFIYHDFLYDAQSTVYELLCTLVELWLSFVNIFPLYREPLYALPFGS